MKKEKLYNLIVRHFLILLGLLILSPILLSLGFKSLKTYTELPKSLISYSLLTIGILLILFTIYFGFKTIRLFLDTLFRKN